MNSVGEKENSNRPVGNTLSFALRSITKTHTVIHKKIV